MLPKSGSKEERAGEVNCIKEYHESEGLGESNPSETRYRPQYLNLKLNENEDRAQWKTN